MSVEEEVEKYLCEFCRQYTRVSDRKTHQHWHDAHQEKGQRAGEYPCCYPDNEYAEELAGAARLTNEFARNSVWNNYPWEDDVFKSRTTHFDHPVGLCISCRNNPIMDPYTGIATELVALSKFVDNSPLNRNRDPEALSWHRVTKAMEEGAEATQKWLNVVGGNPRKGVCATVDDVVEELLDAAISALAGVEHLQGHKGRAVQMMKDRLDYVIKRLQEETPEEENYVE